MPRRPARGSIGVSKGRPVSSPGRFPFGTRSGILRIMGEPAFNYRDLPIDERLQLVEDIWDSIAQEANVRAERLPLSEAQRTELRQRIESADAHPDDAIPWDAVREELFKRG